MEISVVVPILNEEECILPMAEGLARLLNGLAGPGNWQLVLCDNGSRDRTPQLAEEICRRWPDCITLNIERPNYGEALRQGFNAAEGEWIYFINADWWDPVFMTWCWNTRGLYDMVLGSKRADYSLNQQPRYRKILSWGLNTLLQFAFGYVGTDTHGQKFLRADAMRPIVMRCVMRRGQFDTEMVLRSMRSGLWLAEVPVPIVEIRPKRNRLIKKIAQNLYDVLRLKRVMRAMPAEHPIRYHRWAREDVVEGGLPKILLSQLADQHRHKLESSNV